MPCENIGLVLARNEIHLSIPFQQQVSKTIQLLDLLLGKLQTISMGDLDDIAVKNRIHELRNTIRLCGIRTGRIIVQYQFSQRPAAEIECIRECFGYLVGADTGTIFYEHTTRDNITSTKSLRNEVG